MLTALGANWPHIANIVLYGLGGFVGVLMIITAIRVLSYLSRQATLVTIKNVESHVKEWVEAFGYGIKKLDIADVHFAYQITVSDDNRVAVLRLKKFDRYLTLTKSLALSKEHQTAFTALSPAAARELISELRIQLASAKAEFRHFELPADKITLTLRIPVTGELTEARFNEAIVDLTRALIIANEVIIVRLSRSDSTPPSCLAPHKGDSQT